MRLLRQARQGQGIAIAVACTMLLPPVLAQGPGTWTRGEPMPSSRSEVAVAEVDGLVYVVGGFGGGGRALGPSP